MPPLRLFGFRVSPFVEKVVRALLWKRLDFEMVAPTTPMATRSWNPQTGKMPVLEIGGDRVFDSTFILRRLERDHPERSLWDRAPDVAARQRQLEDWSDESLYWYIMAVRWAEPNARATTEQVVGSLPGWIRPAGRFVIPRQVGAMVRAQGLGRLSHPMLVAEFGHLLDDLVWILGEQRFFHAEAPSAADFSVYGQLNAARSGPTPELGDLIAHRPALTGWMERVEEITGSANDRSPQ